MFTYNYWFGSTQQAEKSDLTTTEVDGFVALIEDVGIPSTAEEARQLIPTWDSNYNATWISFVIEGLDYHIKTSVGDYQYRFDIVKNELELIHYSEFPQGENKIRTLLDRVDILDQEWLSCITDRDEIRINTRKASYWFKYINHRLVWQDETIVPPKKEVHFVDDVNNIPTKLSDSAIVRGKYLGCTFRKECHANGALPDHAVIEKRKLVQHNLNRAYYAVRSDGKWYWDPKSYEVSIFRGQLRTLHGNL